MDANNRKVAIIGAGLVGTSCAYALLNQRACDELVLIDIDKKRAMGEAMDLSHGVAFSGANMRIYAGTYADCRDADIILLSAGVNQKPGESRLDLLRKNTDIFKSIIDQIAESGFNGIFLIATNPVDVMTRITYMLSGFPASSVIGTGTTLDTARLRYLLGQYFGVDPRNVHAYVMGEHGDSEFVPWSQASISTKSVLRICKGDTYCLNDLYTLSEEVRDAAQSIISAKGATYYGIGMALVRIIQAIFGNENSVLTVSTLLYGTYGEETDVFAGVPAVIGNNGVRRVIELDLTEAELRKFADSCDILKKTYDEVFLGGGIIL